MKHTQRHAVIAWLIIILDILFFLPCVATGAAVDVAGVYGKEQGVEVVKGWGQCGGYEYSGPAECETGFACRKQHEAYYQCLPNGPRLTPGPVLNSGAPTRLPAASPEPTTPTLFLPPRTITVNQKEGTEAAEEAMFEQFTTRLGEAAAK